MKRLHAIFDLLIVMVMVSVLTACGGRGHEYSKTTTIMDVDGNPESVEAIHYESDLKLLGQKLDVSDLSVTDTVGTNGWSYGVQAAAVSAEPKSVLLETFEKIVVAAAPVAIDAAMKYFTGAGAGASPAEPPETAFSDEDVEDVRALLTELRAERDRVEE